VSSPIRSIKSDSKAEIKNSKTANVRYASIRGISLKILDALARSGELSTKDLAEQLGISYNLAKLYVYNLRLYGLINISYYNYYYYYSLTDKGRALLEEKRQLLATSISSINSVNDDMKNAQAIIKGISSISSISSIRSISSSTNIADARSILELIKAKYNLSETAVVVVEVLLDNYLKSACRRKYMRFTDSYQLDEEFKLKHEELIEALRELENRGVIYVFILKGVVKIGLMQGFVDELMRVGLQCS